jgi:N-methylhydantoinase A
MQSNGGVLSAQQVAHQPIATLLSGPAAGALGASFLAGLAGYPNVLTVDAGGTSTDICVVEGGIPHITTEGTVGRFPVKVPMIDISTIGTGGGSIAWIDPSGGLHVGPRSAGADPGPMCYGKGGDEPTLTDANVFLGRLPPHLLGGEVPLDIDRARFGLERLAKRLDLDATRLAAGILEIADWNQVNAIRQVTVKKGLDPRDYTMVPFGGSGPLQAARVAQLLGLTTIMVPPNPGNVSALGLLAVDLKMD